jgi:hypothetical protein
MDNRLKTVKAEIQETIFKDFQFDERKRQKVHQLIHSSKAKDKVVHWKQRTKYRFQGLLTVFAYCVMFFVISSVVIQYINDDATNSPGQMKNSEQNVVENPLDGKLVAKNVLTQKLYKNNTYSLQLTIPDSWLNRVQVEEMEYGIRFFYTGSDGNTQDLITIAVEKLSNRLKSIYEGGPDPSTEIAVLGDFVYRYFTPLDLVLTNELDLQEYSKLSEELTNVMSSFQLVNKTGFVGETPYIYGFTPQFNDIYGFEVNIPKKWQNLYKVEVSEKEMKFLFQKPGAEPAEFLSILTIKQEDWNHLQMKKKEDKEYTEITRKDGVSYIASVVNVNPYEDGEFLYPFEMLRNESKFVVESFQFLE